MMNSFVGFDGKQQGLKEEGNENLSLRGEVTTTFISSVDRGLRFVQGRKVRSLDKED